MMRNVAVFCCQFIKGQRWPELTLRLVQSLSLGQKDAHRTLFSVWQHVFAMPKAKRYVHTLYNYFVCSVCVRRIFCIFRTCRWMVVHLWLQETLCKSIWSDGQCTASWGAEANEWGKQLVIDVKVSSVFVVVVKVISAWSDGECTYCICALDLPVAKTMDLLFWFFYLWVTAVEVPKCCL